MYLTYTVGDLRKMLATCGDGAPIRVVIEEDSVWCDDCYVDQKVAKLVVDFPSYGERSVLLTSEDY